VGLAVRALRLPPGALLVTVERGERTIVPQGSTVLEAGDVVTVFAPPPQFEATLVALRGAAQEHEAHA
jgi:Trk K+ transport system NAD-binding subunit